MTCQVRAMHGYLLSVGEWDRTYFLWTSDHGYNLGQFRVDSHKTMVYDHCAPRHPPLPACAPYARVLSLISGLTRVRARSSRQARASPL